MYFANKEQKKSSCRYLKQVTLLLNILDFFPTIESYKFRRWARCDLSENYTKIFRWFFSHFKYRLPLNDHKKFANWNRPFRLIFAYSHHCMCTIGKGLQETCFQLSTLTWNYKKKRFELIRVKKFFAQKALEREKLCKKSLC
jgi:hypothetical protein